MLPRLRTPSFYSPTKATAQPWSCLAKTAHRERICCRTKLRRERNNSFFRQVSPLSGDFGAYSRKGKSISESLRRFQVKHEETAIEIESKRRKKTLYRLLRRHMGVKLSSWDVYRFNEEEIALRAAHIRSWRLAKAAAKTMIKWLRNVRIAHKRQCDQTRMHVAAFYIQQQWKRYWVMSTQRDIVLPRKQENRRRRAAVVIQKWIRGHFAREKCQKMRLLRQVNSLHFHYKRVQYKAMETKAPVIWKSWQNYKQRKLALDMHKKKEKVAKVFIELVKDVVRSPNRKGNTTSKTPEVMSLTPPAYKKMNSEPQDKVSPRDSVGGKTPIARQRSRTDPVAVLPRSQIEPATAPVRGRKK